MNDAQNPQGSKFYSLLGKVQSAEKLFLSGRRNREADLESAVMQLPHEQKPNPYLDAFIEFEHFFIRKVMLIKYSSAFIVMPGGFGTLDEAFEVLMLGQPAATPEEAVRLIKEADRETPE
jgi:hypothetical protein